MAQPEVDVAKRPADTREVMEDRVPQARIYRVWNVAQTGTVDADRLQLVANILGSSKTSRLQRRLVHEEQLVDFISAFQSDSQLGSNFEIIANVKDGVEPERGEAIIEDRKSVV